MPRRALFCPKCTELLDQLEKAADAVCREESTFPQPRERAPNGGSMPQVDLRAQYLRIKERAQEHFERHADFRKTESLSSSAANASQTAI